MSVHTRLLAAPVVAIAAVALAAGPAAAENQPGDFGNVANIERGASAPGPHCHVVLGAGGESGFTIVSATAHEGHTHTSGIFAATACP